MKLEALLMPVFLVALFIGIPPSPVVADNAVGVHELRLGLLAHDVDGLWSRSRREEGSDFNAEVILTPGLNLWGGTVRPNLGFSVNDRGLTGKVYAGALWHHIWYKRFFLELGLGLAVHNGVTDDASRPDRKQLGTRLLLRVPIEAGFAWREHHSLSVMFDHVSNAYFADPNEGMDTVGLRYGYRF
jgi:lipid A 3-O-deacylase